MRYRMPGRRRGVGVWKLRLIIAAVIALVALGGYVFNISENPITGASERVGGISIEQEVQLGLASMPEMASQFGGESTNAEARAVVDAVGRQLVGAMREVYGVDEVPYEFRFVLLDDDQVVNAFALPGGPTFITDALFDQLETRGQLAGVLGHEIGHVIHRHGLKRMAQQNMLQGLASAATVGAGDYSAGQAAAMVGNLVSMSYGRDQELECDAEGIKLMVAAGYDPRAMITVMQVLKAASGGGGGAPEWASTHPDPDNRAQRIEAMIHELFPDGVPAGLEP